MSLKRHKRRGGIFGKRKGLKAGTEGSRDDIGVYVLIPACMKAS